MHILENKFIEHIRKLGLFGKEHRLLAAVSGGIDSVVMVYLLKAGGYNFGITHCNFQLRGQEADDDAVFVFKLADALGVPFHGTVFETSSYARQHGLSIQVAARKLRYQWFEEVCEWHQYDYVLTAHQMNDVMETMLYNLSKGTGLAGLHGIAAKRKRLIRPMLSITRKEIELYATERNLHWREDSSNASDKYSRNLIRNKVVPALRQINPNIEHTMMRTAFQMASVEQLLHYELSVWQKQFVKQEADVCYIEYAPWVDLPGAEARLFYLIQPFGFSFSDAGAILSATGRLSGKSFYSSSHVLVKDRGRLVIVPASSASQPEVYAVEHSPESTVNAPYARLYFRLGTHPGAALFQSDDQEAWLDTSRLNFPLHLRTWAHGDRFIPLGMKGKKKVSDFLNDKKIPLNLKNRTLVLCSGTDIVWVVGHRIDDRYKLNPNSREALHCRIVG